MHTPNTLLICKGVTLLEMIADQLFHNSTIAIKNVVAVDTENGSLDFLKQKYSIETTYTTKKAIENYQTEKKEKKEQKSDEPEPEFDIKSHTRFSSHVFLAGFTLKESAWLEDIIMDRPESMPLTFFDLDQKYCFVKRTSQIF
jgi:hypothetical protein